MVRPDSACRPWQAALDSGNRLICKIPAKMTDPLGDTGMWRRLVVGVRESPAAFWTDFAVKAAMICLLAFGAFSGLQQFEGKAFTWRLAVYPPAVLAITIVWAIWGRRSAFPYAADILFTLPFLIDTGGNALDLYDTIEWWDDANHLVNWALLSGAIGALSWRSRIGSWQTLSFVVGFGAVTAICWEIAEYLTFIRNSPELATAYTDTLGDLALGLAGSILAGLVAAWAPRPSRRVLDTALTRA